jgi:hypothetical protein
MSSIIKVDNIQNAAGVAAITIDSNGFVAPKVPLFKVSLDSNSADYSSNNWLLIDWSATGSVEFDNTSAWNSANEKWTPQTAGYYHVNCQVTSGSGTIRSVGAAIYKNGSEYHKSNFWAGAEADGDDLETSFSTIMYLNGSSDYIQLYGYIYDSVAGVDRFFGSKRTSFSAHYISS